MQKRVGENMVINTAQTPIESQYDPSTLDRVSAGTSEKTKLAALLLLILLGPLGAHRFYVGKIGSGVLFLITLGGLGIWWLVDLYKIITDKFTDKNGRLLAKKNEL